MTQPELSTATSEPARPSAALIVGDAPVRLWGLSSRQRIEKQLSRLQIPLRASIAGESGRVLVLNAGWVFDEPLLRALAQAPEASLLLDPANGMPVAAKVAADQGAAIVRLLSTDTPRSDAFPDGLVRCTPSTLVSGYNKLLRKRETPYLLPLSAATLPAIEKRMFAGSYKGVTDLVTKYLWPLPARHVTKWCALAGISPNAVTFVGLLMVIAAFRAFWDGHFGVGLVAAWIMTFLDTVDGKLARVTMNSSRFGDIFDHGIDLIHPPFWYWAWVVGLNRIGLPLDQLSLILWIVIGGYVAQRAEELVFERGFKIQMHTWRPIDSFFRLITARRNPNLLLLTLAALVGRPDLGVIAVAVWTLICFWLHALQIVQAFAASRHGPIDSWLNR